MSTQPQEMHPVATYVIESLERRADRRVSLSTARLQEVRARLARVKAVDQVRHAVESLAVLAWRLQTQFNSRSVACALLDLAREAVDRLARAGAQVDELREVLLINARRFARFTGKALRVTAPREDARPPSGSQALASMVPVRLR